MYIDTDLSQILPFKKKFIYFCTENIYPNYINGILYSKTGYYSPFRRLVPTCLLYLVRHTCIEKVFSAMTNWGRSVTSKWPEKRMKRHLVAKMLLFLLIENWPDYHKTGNDTRIHAHTYCAYNYVVCVLFLGKSTCSINYNTDWMLITFLRKEVIKGARHRSTSATMIYGVFFLL